MQRIAIYFGESLHDLSLIFVLNYYSVSKRSFKDIADITTMHCDKAHVTNKKVLPITNIMKITATSRCKLHV